MKLEALSNRVAACFLALFLSGTAAVFSPCTAADPPTVSLRQPVVAGQWFGCPPDVALHWVWPEVASVRPDSSRWVLIESNVSLNQFTSFPDSLFTLPERYQWSPWRAWNAPDGSGMRAVFRDLTRLGTSPRSGHYIFAVQVMDKNGNVTPSFNWLTPQRNNVALIVVKGISGPVVRLTEPSLGSGGFVGATAVVRLDMAARQSLQFRWSADASPYGGDAVESRYAWDLPHPGEEEGWSPWSATLSSAGHSFSSGAHTFHLEARDDLGIVAGAALLIDVIPRNARRDLLWVDDTDHLDDAATEIIEDARWIDVLDQVSLANDLTFDSALDVYDVQQHQGAPPSVDLLFEYNVVLWSVRSGASGTSGLREEAQFFDPLASRYLNSSRGFNDLNLYVSSGGRLWINGFRPETQLWPQERSAGQEQDPVNVTNWNDPLEPHPDVDSVGTTSLAYRMGIEMFDVGASLNSPRHLQHCLGFHGTAGAPELQLDPAWAEGASGGRKNISIYNMPSALASQIPPLAPSPGTVRVLYTYRSNLPEDPSQGFVYPQTADAQPAFLLAKTTSEEAHSSVAICGFEPYLLTRASHVQLLTHLLIKEMGMGPSPVLLAHMTAEALPAAVRIDWDLLVPTGPPAFRLQARTSTAQWEVPYNAVDHHTFTAMDDSPHLVPGETVDYVLFMDDPVSGWILVAQERVTLPLPARVARLLPPRPNPFNPRTEITYVLPEQEQVRLRVFGLDGKVVATLVDGVRPGGRNAVLWEGMDGSGRAAASGLYLVRLEAGGVIASRKLVLLK